jgi:hypothetical protein
MPDGGKFASLTSENCGVGARELSTSWLEVPGSVFIRIMDGLWSPPPECTEPCEPQSRKKEKEKGSKEKRTYNNGKKIAKILKIEGEGKQKGKCILKMQKEM